jgi:hypothetical protein
MPRAEADCEFCNFVSSLVVSPGGKRWVDLQTGIVGSLEDFTHGNYPTSLASYYVCKYWVWLYDSV